MSATLYILNKLVVKKVTIQCDWAMVDVLYLDLQANAIIKVIITFNYRKM